MLAKKRSNALQRYRLRTSCLSSIGLPCCHAALPEAWSGEKTVPWQNQRCGGKWFRLPTTSRKHDAPHHPAVQQVHCDCIMRLHIFKRGDSNRLDLFLQKSVIHSQKAYRLMSSSKRRRSLPSTCCAHGRNATRTASLVAMLPHCFQIITKPQFPSASRLRQRAFGK